MISIVTTKSRPGVKLPDQSFRNPTIAGVAAEPPAMPTEVISAIPAGRASAERIAADVGIVQKVSNPQNDPTDTSTSPRNRTSAAASAQATSSQPVAARSIATRKCQDRSFLRSELA